MLIDPLDLLRFIAAYAAVALLPGYALAALARPRADWVERAAFAIPCAYSLVVLVGLATALLRLPFTLLSYAVLATPVTLASIYTSWRGRTDQPAKVARWWIVPIGVALAQVGAIIIVYMSDTVPPGSDVVSHVIWTNVIARSHIFPIALMSSHAGANDGGFYPPAFHAMTALVLGIAPMATYRAVFYSIVVAIAALPLALFCYTRLVTGSARVGAWAAIVSLAFEPLPFFVVTESLYPLTTSLLIVPALALALRDGIGQRDRRALALAVVLGIGLFYTHPTELLTAALLAFAVVPVLLRSVRDWTHAAVSALAVLACWLAAAAPALSAVRKTMVSGAQTEIQGSHMFVRPPRVDLAGVLHGYVYWVYGLNVSYLLLVAVVAGSLWCVLRRRLRGLVAIQVLIILIFIDSNSYNVLQKLYTLAFPWALLDRMIATHYWTALPLAALGVDAVMQYARRRLTGMAYPFKAIVAAPAIIIGLLVPLDVAAARSAAYTNARRDVAPADLSAIAWLAHHAPANSTVINDGEIDPPASFEVPIDAGLWMPALDGPQPLLAREGGGPGDIGDRFYVIEHIADPRLPPRAIRYIDAYRVRYVFYGEEVRPGVIRHLNVTRLLADPRLRLVYTSEPGCHDIDHMTKTTRCPTTGSYVFSLALVTTHLTAN